MRVLVLVMVLMAQVGYGQELRLSTNKWKDGQTVKIKGHGITKVDCKGYGITNASWITQKESIAEVNEMADKEMWSTKERKEQLDYSTVYEVGGAITLYIARSTIEGANTEWYKVIVKDEVGNEVFRKQLKEDVPNVPGSDDLWWNNAYIPLPKIVNTPFDLYIIEEGSPNPKCHFKVLD